MSRNGTPALVDRDLHSLLFAIQEQRFSNGADKKRKSITRISRMAAEILSLNKNYNKLLTRRCK